MTYSAEIKRSQPACLIFLIDQSYSMGDPIGAPKSEPSSGQRKADALADAINAFLASLTIRCAAPEGIRDYFHAAVIGYGNNGLVEPAFGGALSGRELVPLSEIADAPLRVDERAKAGGDGAPVKSPVWFDAVASQGTPMCSALAKAKALVQQWLGDHPDGFPPIVLNFTDGEATDGDPLPGSTELRDLASNDGPVLLFNLHLSETAGDPIYFPESSSGLPDDFAKQLFEMSSVLPSTFRREAARAGFSVSDVARGFVFNADLSAIVKFLEIGTKVDDQLR